jgi:26S proteasome regulatory subunit N3
VCIRDLELFRCAAEKNSSVFTVDKSHNLIVRLWHNVIQMGLRNISIAYLRISLIDVATKLHLDSTTSLDDAGSIVTMAIRDGGIGASVDYSKGCMQSKETSDIYSTQVCQLEKKTL